MSGLGMQEGRVGCRVPEGVTLGPDDGVGEVGAPENIAQKQRSLASQPDAQTRAFCGEAEHLGLGDGVARLAWDADGDEIIIDLDGFVANGAGNGRDATGGDLPRLARTVTALDLVLMVLASLNEAEADAEDVA
ncbi:hypothetical protein CYMTET_39520 [Cymbomonas tetramitiformis]|uniref:Uncharacterized protein n=1 Tax=Cymbomonas tetramitiformis TaxID=36881 RepID=A0AAE0C9Y4_9CHLO|nr:hypothetical protein CYMTET_39520 [Cymbomonas tetramitiformis]